MFLIDSSQDLLTMSKPESIISDKISPPSHLPRISRARLIKMIENSTLAGTSTIISGRAGTGKTTLALDFAEKCRRSVAWYKVDAPDADRRFFFNYLIRSIQQARPSFGALSLLSHIEIAGVEPVTWLAESLVYELAESESGGPLLIVIEDLHLVSDSDWLVPFLGRLLPLLPSQVHVLITSRSLPTTPLWRMRSKQSLVVIDEAALAFTRAEANELFESYGLSGDQAGIALDHTHGRAAALDESAATLRSESPA
jgi:LuxR family maltose regulon positive regulatory protein